MTRARRNVRRLVLAGSLVVCVSSAAATPVAETSSATQRSTVSWAGTHDAWAIRETGVYATEDAGKSWHQVYPDPALAIVRLSRSAGLIEVGIDPGPCMCTTRKLWTNDDGVTWHDTNAVSGDFAGSGSDLYWWEGGTLHVITDFPPTAADARLDAKTAISLSDGTIVGTAELADNGLAVLVSNRVDGQHWDGDPRVLIAHGTDVQTVRLPAQHGQILAERIEAVGTDLTVTGTDFGAEPAAEVTWSSDDGGTTWSVGG